VVAVDAEEAGEVRGHEDDVEVDGQVEHLSRESVVWCCPSAV
jgi:hypothetical protein